MGHGAPPSDYPKERLQRLKRLEAERAARGSLDMSPEEAALDREIRAWPRTRETDPYKHGLEELARALALRTSRRVIPAYNEFCGPGIEEAVGAAAADGAREFTLVSTMYTRGGVHSECEIPALVDALRRRRPDLRIDYAWPFDAARVAGFLADHIEAAATRPGAAL